MHQIFIELYKYRPSWLDKPLNEREQFVTGVLDAIEKLTANGVNVIGWGYNDLETDHRASYDFFCVYTVPSFAFQKLFDEAIAQSGWHEFFEQVAASGAIRSPSDILSENAALKVPEKVT